MQGNIIPLLIFAVLLIINYKKVGRVVALSNYILLLYTISALSFYILTLIKTGIYYNIEALSLIAVTTYILIKPLQIFESKNLGSKLSPINKNNFSFLVNIILITSLIAIIFFGKNIGKLASIDIADFRNAKSSLYEGGTMISKISCFGAYLSLISIPLAFWNTITKTLPNKYSSLLLISSLAFVLYTINVAGRDGAVIWAILMGGCYCLFNCYLTPDQKKKYKKLLISGIVLLLPVFITISSVRFSDGDGGVGGSFISYLGQNLYVLSYNIDVSKAIIHEPDGAKALFELFYNLLGLDSVERFENMDIALNFGFLANGFSYYIGSFYPANLTLLGTLLFMGLCLIIYYFSFRIKKHIADSARLFTGIAWLYIVIIGVFYFYFGTLIGNAFLLFALLLPILLKYKI